MKRNSFQQRVGSRVDTLAGLGGDIQAGIETIGHTLEAPEPASSEFYTGDGSSGGTVIECKPPDRLAAQVRKQMHEAGAGPQ